jgi:hypothetical protein
MSGPDAPLPPSPRTPSAWLARAVLGLYPPSWRARYGGEVCALIEQAGSGYRTMLSLAWHALPAWICPPRQLHDKPARMRASLATLLLSGAMLTGLGLVSAQLTQFQGDRLPGHPVIGVAYGVFDAALAAAALIAGAGALPLWLLMLRRALRERRSRVIAWLVLPAAAPCAFLLALLAAGRLVGSAEGVGHWWFLVLTATGFGAAAASALGPGLALRSLRPRGPALRLATAAAGLAAAALVVAASASAVAVIGLYLWAAAPSIARLPVGTWLPARHSFAAISAGAPVHTTVFVGYQHGRVIAGYLVVVASMMATVIVSAARGTRAALNGTAGG